MTTRISNLRTFLRKRPQTAVKTQPQTTGATVWYAWDDDQDQVVASINGDTFDIDRDRAMANMDHPDVTTERHDISESPFDE